MPAGLFTNIVFVPLSPKKKACSHEKNALFPIPQPRLTHMLSPNYFSYLQRCGQGKGLHGKKICNVTIIRSFDGKRSVVYYVGHGSIQK